MKKRYALLAIGLAGTLIRIIAGNSTDATQNRRPASEAVRQMASYLEVASPQTVAALGGRMDPAADSAGAGQLSLNPSGDAVSATEAGLIRIEQTESRIAARYPQSVSGGIIRRYVALVLNDVDTDYRPDLSRVRAMNDLMQNAPAAAADLQAAIDALPVDEASSSAERAALLQLATHVGNNEHALPAIENILLSEMGRRARLDSDANGQRLGSLIDSYTTLIADPRKQADFVRTGIQMQEDPRSRELLENSLESIMHRLDVGQRQEQAPRDET